MSKNGHIWQWPLTRYIKFRVVFAPGMPRMFSPAYWNLEWSRCQFCRHWRPEVVIMTSPRIVSDDKLGIIETTSDIACDALWQLFIFSAEGCVPKQKQISGLIITCLKVSCPTCCLPSWQWISTVTSNTDGHTMNLLSWSSAKIAVNTWRPGQNGRYFPDDIFKYIFLNENERIWIEISLMFGLKGPNNSIPALVQIMTWHRTGFWRIYSPCIRPQWVN